MSTETKKQAADRLRDDAIEYLRELLKPGDEVCTIFRHVSKSGMSRSIDLVIARGDKVLEITYQAARAMGDRIDQKNGGIVQGGCGMDMGFGLVYNLSRTLYPDGFDCVGPVYYLQDSELSEGPYPHLRTISFLSTGEPTSGTREVYAEPLEGAGGFLPAYLSTRHTCPSNDHSNKHMTFHHDSGGYALRQRWL